MARNDYRMKWMNHIGIQLMDHFIYRIGIKYGTKYIHIFWTKKTISMKFCRSYQLYLIPVLILMKFFPISWYTLLVGEFGCHHLQWFIKWIFNYDWNILYTNNFRKFSRITFQLVLLIVSAEVSQVQWKIVLFNEFSSYSVLRHKVFRQ